MKKNNFEEYGYAANFEGEILKKTHGCYIGYVLGDGEIVPCKWEAGLCYYHFCRHEKYDLTPIKKKWYEDEFSVGKTVVDTEINQMLTFYGYIKELNQAQLGVSKNVKYYTSINNVRPATKEELLNLLIKE